LAVLSIYNWDQFCYTIIRKEVNTMAKKKRRRRRPTAQPYRMESFLADLLAGIISGLTTAAILKLLNW